VSDTHERETTMKLTGNVTLSLGYVMVETDVVDCEGTRRLIFVPRLTGTTLYHWTVRPLVRQAQQVARKYLRTAKPKRGPIVVS
jgi:hypothetical protein